MRVMQWRQLGSFQPETDHIQHGRALLLIPICETVSVSIMVELCREAGIPGSLLTPLRCFHVEVGQCSTIQIAAHQHLVFGMNNLWLEAQEAEIAQSDASSKMPVATSLLSLGNDFEGFGDVFGEYGSLLLRKVLHGGATKTGHGKILLEHVPVVARRVVAVGIFRVMHLVQIFDEAQRKGTGEAFLRLLAAGEGKGIESQLFHFLVEEWLVPLRWKCLRFKGHAVPVSLAQDSFQLVTGMLQMRKEAALVVTGQSLLDAFLAGLLHAPVEAVHELVSPGSLPMCQSTHQRGGR